MKHATDMRLLQLGSFVYHRYARPGATGSNSLGTTSQVLYNLLGTVGHALQPTGPSSSVQL
jgi:hypothetical protein